MKFKPNITTIIPTYKRPKLLRHAVESVLNQTYPHFRICIYDNDSGDETAAVIADIAKQDSRVKYHCHTQNIGSIPNFNYGLKQVKTPYYSFLSDDNTLLPHFYENAIETLTKYKEAVFFAGRTILLNSKSQIIGHSLVDWDGGLIQPPDGLLDIWELGLPTWEGVLFRSQVIKSVGLLDASVHGAADYDFLMKIARKHLFYISKEPCASFYVHNNSEGTGRELSESVSSGRKILNRWLNDNDLSDELKERLMTRWKLFVEHRICSCLLRKSILGNDVKTISTAEELMRKELGLTFRSQRALIAAKLVNKNAVLRWVLSSFIDGYIKLKKNYKVFRNRTKHATL